MPIQRTAPRDTPVRFVASRFPSPSGNVRLRFTPSAGNHFNPVSDRQRFGINGKVRGGRVAAGARRDVEAASIGVHDYPL